MNDGPIQTITVAGVTFTAEQVVEATLKIDGREVHISKPEEQKRACGFNVDGSKRVD